MVNTTHLAGLILVDAEGRITQRCAVCGVLLVALQAPITLQFAYNVYPVGQYIVTNSGNSELKPITDRLDKQPADFCLGLIEQP